MTITQDMRMLDKVLIGDDCWEWTASHDLDGYGVAWYNNKQQGAHRVLWQMFMGPVKDGMQLDHLCRNTGCVKFTHLEEVTLQENNLRSNSISGMNSRKTHCLNDHEFTSSNTYIHPKRGTRHCRACQKARQQERRGGGSIGTS